MKVWVTRTQPGADTTAQRLRELNFEPLVAPLLAIEPLAADLALEGAAALAFTSPHAIRPPVDPDLPVFAVGPATAQAALQAGYLDVHVGPADAAALGALIAQSLPPGAVVLHPCALERAGDLAGALSAAGQSLRAVPVYRSVVAPFDSAMEAALTLAEAVLLHSPKGAQALNALLDSRPTPALRAFCLSQAVAHALDERNFASVAYPALPNDTALLKLL
jgi:uroporphyrinogen-III synthase